MGDIYLRKHSRLQLSSTKLSVALYYEILVILAPLDVQDHLQEFRNWISYLNFVYIMNIYRFLVDFYWEKYSYVAESTMAVKSLRAA